MVLSISRQGGLESPTGFSSGIDSDACREILPRAQGWLCIWSVFFDSCRATRPVFGVPLLLLSVAKAAMRRREIGTILITRRCLLAAIDPITAAL